jgi:hypothetical protein
MSVLSDGFYTTGRDFQSFKENDSHFKFCGLKEFSTNKICSYWLCVMDLIMSGSIIGTPLIPLGVVWVQQ